MKNLLYFLVVVLFCFSLKAISTVSLGSVAAILFVVSICFHYALCLIVNKLPH